MAVARITKRLVDACKPADKPVFIFDESLKGFGLKVNPTGGKNYIVEYRVGAGGRLTRKRRITIGGTSNMTPDQARKKSREILAVARTGIDQASTRSKERKVPDFKTFAYRYLDKEATSRLKPATIQNYEINIRKHAIPFIGPLKLTEISRVEIQLLHSTIGRCTKIQANRTVETISAVYRYAQALGIIEDGYNPTNGIKSFKETPRAGYLSEGEFMRLGAAIRLAETEGIPWELSANGSASKHTTKSQYQRTVFPTGATDTIRLLMFTGCRLREILNLTWAETDLERGLLFLADGKTGASRQVRFVRLSLRVFRCTKS